LGHKYNIGILAHVDAGKTTVTEQLLLKSGSIRTGGSVDEGTTQTDFLEVERKRGISVKNACISLTCGGNEIRIIDTPGHVDFAGEVSRSLQAIDGAVLLLSGVEGVQAQTLAIFRALRKMELPTVLVCNKIDRDGFDRERFERELRQELTGRYAPAADPGALFAALADVDEEMEEAFLLDEMPEEQVLRDCLRKHAKKGEIFPLLYTSAKEGRGINELLDTIVGCLPSAEERELPELSGTVFGLQHDAAMGKVAFVRLFGGRLSARDRVPVEGMEEEEQEKVTQIRRIRGGRFEDVGIMEAGDIAAVYGLTKIRVGDVIGRRDESRGRDSFEARPLLLTEVKTADPEREQELSQALTELSEEDPLLEFERNVMTGQMLLHIMGEIQTEILQEILSGRFGLEVSFSKPRVIFRERPKHRGEGFEAYTMPKPCWAIVGLTVEPLPAGSGIVFESKVQEFDIPYRYQTHVEISVRKTLRQGLFGWEVPDLKVTLSGGNYHHIHTHPLDFFVATPVALLRALQDGEEELLEPYMRVELSADEAVLGKVMGQIIGMRGTFEPPEVRDGKFFMESVMPLRDSLDYPVTFRSLTSGRGEIRMELLDYRPVTDGTVETLPRNGVDPLDRAKWILACRSALGKDLTGR